MNNLAVQLGRLTGINPETGKQTQGILTVYSGMTKLFQCFTLELPWLNNSPNVSCIPTGIYQVEQRYSPKYGNHFHILNVPGREWILIHQANYVRQLRGCVAVGERFTDIDGDRLRDVTNSKATMQKLLDILPETFELEIINFL